MTKMSDYKTPYQKESVRDLVRSLWRSYAPARIRIGK
jgi:hypothetical protein